MGGKKSVDGPHYVDKVVGARVRIRRRELGVSQQQLAERLGLTFQQVQKYETGGNRISASKLYEVSQLLSVPTEFFFADLPHPVTGEGGSNLGGVTEALLNTDIMETLTWMVALSPQEKRLVRNLAGGLLKMREEGRRAVLATPLAEPSPPPLLEAPRVVVEPVEVIQRRKRPGPAKTHGRLLLEKLAQEPMGSEVKASSWMFTSASALDQMIHKVGHAKWAQVTPEKGGYRIRKIAEPDESRASE